MISKNTCVSFCVGQNRVTCQQDFQDYCVNVSGPLQIEITARYE